jgi:hypothetical protein
MPFLGQRPGGYYCLATGRVDQYQRTMGPWSDTTGSERTRNQYRLLGWFDEPQLDAEGGGPYSGGVIWEQGLRLVAAKLTSSSDYS